MIEGLNEAEIWQVLRLMVKFTLREGPPSLLPRLRILSTSDMKLLLTYNMGLYRSSLHKGEGKQRSWPCPLCPSFEACQCPHKEFHQSWRGCQRWVFFPQAPKFHPQNPQSWCHQSPVTIRIRAWFFLAVQNSSIGDLVTHSVTVLLLLTYRVTLETCDLWDIWSEWWRDMTWPKNLNFLELFLNFFWNFFNSFLELFL